MNLANTSLGFKMVLAALVFATAWGVAMTFFRAGRSPDDFPDYVEDPAYAPGWITLLTISIMFLVGWKKLGDPVMFLLDALAGDSISDEPMFFVLLAAFFVYVIERFTVRMMPFRYCRGCRGRMLGYRDGWVGSFHVCHRCRVCFVYKESW